MEMSKSIAISLVLILLMVALSAYFYPQLPDEIATHWNAEGLADNYSSKAVGLSIIPLISLMMLGLFAAIPKIDPLASNIKKFMKYYEIMVIGVVAFLAYIHILIISWNLGLKFEMSLTIMPATGFLLIYIGLIIKHAKRNWFIGIRTPWTLSNDDVWDETHKLGSKLFVVLGLVFILSPLLREYMLYLILISSFVVVSLLVVYSYVLWRKLGQ